MSLFFLVFFFFLETWVIVCIYFSIHIIKIKNIVTYNKEKESQIIAEF